MATPQKTRNIAKKYSIEKIQLAKFVISQNFEEPNYVLFENNDKAYRVNIIGAIVDKNNDDGRESLTIDDGLSINIKAFTDIDFKDYAIGDVVNVIGRPRQNSSGKFIAIESIVKVDKAWISVRKKELLFYEKLYETLDREESSKVENTAIVEPIKEEKISSSITSDPKSIIQEIINIIESLDKGEGANFIDVLNKLKDSNVDLEKSELLINKMILDGDVFEISGNLKISK